jgi:hypothetical protein
MDPTFPNGTQTFHYQAQDVSPVLRTQVWDQPPQLKIRPIEATCHCAVGSIQAKLSCEGKKKSWEEIHVVLSPFKTRPSYLLFDLIVENSEMTKLLPSVLCTLPWRGTF